MPRYPALAVMAALSLSLTAAAGEFTLYSWNAQAGQSSTMNTSVRAKIVSMNPDIILLVEAGSSNGVISLVNELSAANGGATYYWKHKRPDFNNRYPLAIVSRYPVNNFQIIGSVNAADGIDDAIETSNNVIRKVMLRADFSIGGDTVTVFGVHADIAGVNSAAVARHRNESMAFITEIAARTAHSNTIVVGDFNSRSVLDGAVNSTNDADYGTADTAYNWDGNTFPNTFSTDHFMTNGYADAWRRMHPAPEAVKPTKMHATDGGGSSHAERIDQMMVSRDLVDRILAAEVLTDVANNLADHRPVFLKIQTSGSATANGGQLTDTAPGIAASVLATNNAYVDVFFTEGLYANANGTGALTTNHFALIFEQHNGGTASGVAVGSVTKKDGSALSGGETLVRAQLTVTGTPSGKETFVIKLAATNVPIYNAGGTSIFYAVRNTTAAIDTLERANRYALISASETVPFAAFTPADGATGVSTGSAITVSFNAAMRHRNNEAISNDARLASLITLRNGGPSGAPLAFTASIDGNKQTVTITPVPPFSATQTVYVAFAGTAVENSSEVFSRDAYAVFTAAAQSSALDNWLIVHYGTTNVNVSATASNGVNTILQTYIAGLNPTNPASVLLISDLRSLTSGNTLQWQGVSGRVYNVYWSSNLLSGFQSLESNVPWTGNIFTDAVHGAENQGFYQIKVKLAE